MLRNKTLKNISVFLGGGGKVCYELSGKRQYLLVLGDVAVLFLMSR